MRAASFDRYGGPEALQEIWTDVPMPKDGEALIRIHAVSVNGYDVMLRSGALKFFTDSKFPKRTGLDFVGEIVTPSGAASLFKSGDSVWGVMPLHGSGSAAEFVCVEDGLLARKPIGLEPAQAAALPVVGVTAMVAVRDIGALQAGQRLLVRGASGGVGSVAVQIGRALDAHVTGLASASHLDLVRQLGADEALDYATTAPSDLGSFDVILDTVGSHPGAYRRLLAAGGRMVAIVPDPQHPLRSMLYFALSSIHGSRRVRFFSAKPNARLLAELAGYVEKGAVRPIVEKVYPLSQIADAHRAMEKGGCRGKQTIQVVERQQVASTP